MPGMSSQHTPGPNYVKQTVLHDPANGQHGNCLSAVLASLLGIPIEQVPVFADTKTWRHDLNRWLRPMGLAYLELQPGAAWMADFGIEGLHHEVYGLTRRSKETLHACVGIDGEVVFDPHPDSTGLVAQEGLSVFIALRPWQARAAIAKALREAS